jgi:hypothetical protein
MWHGVLLCKEHIEALDRLREQGRLTAADAARIRSLRAELALRRAVMANVETPEALSPVGRVWREYMTGHAALQVARYAGDIDEDTFFERCRDIRRTRDEQLSRVMGGAA